MGIEEEALPPRRAAGAARVRVKARRWIQLIVGLFLYGVAIALMIRSGLGLGPWDAFHVGLHRLTGMTVGVASIVVGLVIIIGTLFIGVRPGPGTLANMVLIGVFIDLLLPLIPAQAGGWLGLAYHVTGIVLTGLATGFYIAPGFGKGPRDGLMLGLAGRTGWSVRRVRTGIEATVLVLGWMMGAKIGIGTILFAAGIGPVTQWGLRLFGVVPEPARVGIRVGRRAPRG
ncbi:MAG TPA: hypothetical protein VF188_01750 [Longimicrobiales bacterium]